MTWKLRFKFLSLAVMLAALATFTWLDKPVSAACSPAAYDGCMGSCESSKERCLQFANEHGSFFVASSCYTSYDGCTCQCARDCFGPATECGSN